MAHEPAAAQRGLHECRLADDQDGCPAHAGTTVGNRSSRRADGDDDAPAPTSSIQSSKGSRASPWLPVFCTPSWCGLRSPQSIAIFGLFDNNDRLLARKVWTYNRSWQRICVSWVADDSHSELRCRLTNASFVANVEYFLWGAQLNQGDLAPYLRTTSAAATRNPGFVGMGVHATKALSIGLGTEIVGHLSATIAWDPSSTADGAIAFTTVKVTGAALGDTVAVGFSTAVPAGALLVGAVSAPDNVTVTLLNKTGRTLDLASGTLRADVWKH